MQLYPTYVTSVFLFIWAMMRALHPSTDSIQARFTGIVSEMIACHEALILYADANQTSFGATIPQATVDAYLAPGTTDPGAFTYQYISPGVVQTYLTFATPHDAIPAAMIQRLNSGNIFAGIVSNGQIVPTAPLSPVPVYGTVPNGTIAIQTILRNH
jgi:hypothetical protein